MRYRAYAKINLTLEVLAKRDDGFHDLASLIHTISLADELRIDSADHLVADVEGMAIDPASNLVARAARLLGQFTRVPFGARLGLVKRIPAAAGLGGGSSDAATTLVGLNALWQTRLRISTLTQLAAQLGSDIPFFLRGGAALMQGRGETLQALPALTAQWLVLVAPPHAVADKTRRLYAALEPGDLSSGEATCHAASRVQHRQPLPEADLVNSFTRPARAVFPGLSDVWLTAERACGRRFFLSGAGPSIFGLAADSADARRQAARLTGLGLNAYAVRTVKRARATLRLAVDSPMRYP